MWWWRRVIHLEYCLNNATASFAKFCLHSQPLDALVEMNFLVNSYNCWDGHQFGEVIFHFGGDYYVVLSSCTNLTDAVLSETLPKLSKQFIQLRRWMHGASDIPCCTCIFEKSQCTSYWCLMKLIRLTMVMLRQFSQSLMAARMGSVDRLRILSRSVIVHQLPNVISALQINCDSWYFYHDLISLKCYHHAQNAIKNDAQSGWSCNGFICCDTNCCNVKKGIFANFRLALGKYLDKFDVTQKGE